jgi:hypothetical protein
MWRAGTVVAGRRQHYFVGRSESDSPIQQFPESDPRNQTAQIKVMLDEVIQHARKDVEKVSDPKAQALFETTAEVLIGLKTAYQDFEERTERAWQ